MNDWSPDSWKKKVVLQQPTYPDEKALEEVLGQLAKLPPLVTSWEVENLKKQLAEASRGERFVLQGGDCSESFQDCDSNTIANKLKILLQMSLVLVHGSKKRVIRMGRMAGQYAKPRSADLETRDGVTLPSYRGDMINGIEFNEAARVPDPQLLLRGYERAALTLNFVRSLVDGGFADLHHPEYWNLDFVPHSPLAQEYQQMADSIGESLRYMETIVGVPAGVINRVDFFACHEGLHLHYEQAQTRRVPHRAGYYNLSTHFPWIGDRTRQLDGAHVEYFRGLSNPVGIKVGPSMDPGELVDLIRLLDPENEPGKITLIHRFGAQKIADHLPALVEKVRSEGLEAIWVCDPMHGNTESTASGYKTRNFDSILRELESAFEIHAELDGHLGGVHFELTGDNVTECTGGARGLSEKDLEAAYKSQVDPRLNYEQSLEMAMRIAHYMTRMSH